MGTVVTFDLDEAAVGELASGHIDASVCQNPYEMVYLDTLHNFRWVVVPKEHPSLTRTYQTQGLHPYDLTLLGVYDDSRARVRQGDALWS